MMNYLRIFAAAAGLLATLLTISCASAPAAEGRENPNRITQEELATVAAANLYDAVHRLRPRWLAARTDRTLAVGGAEATGIVVYQGQTYLGGPEALRQLSLAAVSSLRYMDGATAAASLPGLSSRVVQGAIIIEPRGARRSTSGSG